MGEFRVKESALVYNGLEKLRFFSTKSFAMSTETGVVATNPLNSLNVAAKSDIGRRREENQDSFGTIDTDYYRCLIVADGMGGAKGGKVASSLAVSVFKELLPLDSPINEEHLLTSVSQANLTIFDRGRSDGDLSGMGTTLVVLAFVDTRLFVVNVGDSRAYRIRGEEVLQLTQDHTLVEELLRSGALSDDEADNHPVSHMLTRSLGPTPSVDVDWWLCNDGPARGDRYLMCSDGLYNLVSPEEFVEVLNEYSLEQAAEELIDRANDRGGSDNITVAIVEVGDDYPVGIEDVQPAVELEVGDEDSTLELDQVEVTGALAEEAESAEALESDETKLNGPMSEEAPVELESEVEEASAKEPAEEESEEESEEKTTEELRAEAIRLASENQVRAAESKKIGTPMQLALSVVFAAIIGFAVGKLSKPSSPHPGATPSAPTAVVVPPLPVARLAPLRTEFGSRGADLLAARHSAVPDVERLGLTTKGEARAPEGSWVEGPYGSFSSEEVINITRRKAVLEEQLKILNQRIQSFNQPISGELGELLSSSSKKMEELRSELQSIRESLDVSTRKLAVWYGRQKRLATTDPINLASEVAVSSDTVKSRKDAFERATWAYLQEAEVLRYNLSDEDQEEKVKKLAEVRLQHKEELAEEVRKAIAAAVSDADKRIAELTLKRDSLQAEIDQRRRDEDYARILMGTDQRAQKEKLRQLVREKEITAAELSELEKLLPDIKAMAGGGSES